MFHQEQNTYPFTLVVEDEVIMSDLTPHQFHDLGSEEVRTTRYVKNLSLLLSRASGTPIVIWRWPIISGVVTLSSNQVSILSSKKLKIGSWKV